MSLTIKDIAFRGFRNYEDFSLEGIGNLTVLIGHNAIGKTNILEGIQLLTSASSFRHPQISQLVQAGAHEARLKLTARDDARMVEIALAMQEGKRRYTVNGKPKAQADVSGIIPSIAFVPDDLELAKKSSSVKRGALDDLGMQLSKSYYTVRRDFEKTVRYKNKLLKDEEGSALIEAINETLLLCATQLFVYRAALFGRIREVATARYAGITRTGEKLEAGYLPSWEHLGAAASPERSIGFDPASLSKAQVREMLERALSEHAAEERARKRSLVGPHNDKIWFFLDGADASQFASQGQQRSIVLAWKLAEVEMVRQSLSVEPVLLLDDVMSELDEGRRDMLVNSVSADTQTFITATDLSAFNADLLGRARVLDLEGAR